MKKMMSNTLPLITVITPAYNRADFLPETIESVLNQNYPNLEYIVLDDGSTDQTVEVLNPYSGRLYWERHANMGEACTVNKGLQMAKGEWVAVVNSDDPVLPNWIDMMLQTAEEQPDALVLYPDWHKIDAESKTISSPYQRDYDYERMLRECICLIGPGAFIHRKALEAENGRDPSFRYVGDFDYWLRLGLHGRFARVPHTLATHRVHAGSATVAQRGKVMADEHIRMMEQLFGRADLPSTIMNCRAESLSTIYYIAAALTLAESYADARRYFRTSFGHSPSTYFSHPKRLAYLLSTVLPSSLQQRLFRRWKTTFQTSG